jgi:hypothetical protein
MDRSGQVAKAQDIFSLNISGKSIGFAYKGHGSARAAIGIGDGDRIASGSYP